MRSFWYMTKFSALHIIVVDEHHVWLFLTFFSHDRDTSRNATSPEVVCGLQETLVDIMVFWDKFVWISAGVLNLRFVAALAWAEGATVEDCCRCSFSLDGWAIAGRRRSCRCCNCYQEWKSTKQAWASSSISEVSPCGDLWPSTAWHWASGTNSSSLPAPKINRFDLVSQVHMPQD